MTSAGKRCFLSLTTRIALLLIHRKKEEAHFKLSFPTAAVDLCRAIHVLLDSLVTTGGEREYTPARGQGCTAIRPRVLQHPLSPASPRAGCEATAMTAGVGTQRGGVSTGEQTPDVKTNDCVLPPEGWLLILLVVIFAVQKLLSLGGGRGERPKREVLYIYTYKIRLICTVVWQKPSPHCRVTFLQLKNKLIKNHK